MNITLCGSMEHQPKMAEVATILKGMGHDVAEPDASSDSATSRRERMNHHFRKIDSSEAILVVNETNRDIEHYVGGNTLMEIAYAYAQGLNIFMLNSLPKTAITDELQAIGPLLLDGDLEAIDRYNASLPKVFMSTESPIKRLAISRAMRRAGIPVRVEGAKTPSGVSEQPATIEETYQGAVNRHEALKSLGIDADYYVTVESGLHPIHPDHSSFGCQVLVYEKKGEARRIGVDVDIEFPKKMLDRVPAEYPDIGVLVQEAYGSVTKDPYPYLTNGKITRQSLLENAFFSLIVQEGVTS